MHLLVVASDRLERLRGRLLLFAPILMGTGIGLYFSLREEPGPLAWAALGLGAGLCLWAARRLLRGAYPGFSVVALGLAALALGLMVAGLRTTLVSGPVLDFRYYGPVEGRVLLIDRSQSDALRLTLDRVRLDRVAPGETPRRVRVSLHGEQRFLDPVPGMRVAVTAFLSGPEGPVEPGGFDFRRMAWYRGIGAVGYARAPALALAPPPDLALPVHRLRRAISQAVLARVPGEAGAFAAAITTGDRSAMGRETTEALRASNLSHLLAISGLHMGLLVGFVFSAVRVVLSLVPRFRQSVDVRRVAAVVALIAGAFYLALSGGAVSTTRAFVMVAVMMGAIIAGRRALTLRAVAIAALILLVIKPESLVEAGFQMSFAATTALVAVFGWLREVPSWRMPRWLRPVFAVVVSSLVAGLATAPFAAAIFNRVAHYGLAANLLAVPVMGSFVMPLAVLSALLSPFGLSWIALGLMRWPIEWILGVAREVAGLEGAVGYVVAPQAGVLAAIALGGLAVILLRGGGRLAGGATVVVALLAWSLASRPDVLVAGSGRLIGAMGAEGRVLSKARGDGFAARSWLENDGEGAAQDRAAARAGLTGEPGARRVERGAFSLVQVAGRGGGARVAPSCAGAVFVVFVGEMPDGPGAKAPAGEDGSGACLLIDEAMLRKTGAIAFRFDRTTSARVTVETVSEVTGNRPWAPRARGAEAAVAELRRQAAGIGASSLDVAEAARRAGFDRPAQ